VTSTPGAPGLRPDRAAGAWAARDEPAVGWSGRVMSALRVVAHLVAVNLLMLAGTLLGGVVLGAFPALAAGHGVLAPIISGAPSERLWHDFWAGYRASWRRMNVLGAPFWCGGALLAVDGLVLSAAPEGAPVVLWAGLAVAAAYGVLALAFLAPAALRGEGLARTWRFVALAPLLSPGVSAAVLVTLAGLVVIGAWAPVLVPLAGASLPLLLTGWLVEHGLRAIDARTGGGQDLPVRDPALPARSTASAEAPAPAVDSRTTIE